MSKRVHFVMDEAFIRRIDKAAKALKISRGEFARRAIETALPKADREPTR